MDEKRARDGGSVRVVHSLSLPYALLSISKTPRRRMSAPDQKTRQAVSFHQINIPSEKNGRNPEI